LQGSGYQVKARTLHMAADTANASAPVWRGVAAAGTMGGLGVAGALPGQDEEQRNASR